MNRIEQIEARRREILLEMGKIRSMRRGTLNEQYLGVPHKGKSEPVLRGPYYVLSRREGDKTVSKRLKSESELDQAREDIKTRKWFKELCREFEELTEELGELSRASEEELKKGLKSPSKKTPK
jgi:pyruvate carboxylase